MSTSTSKSSRSWHWWVNAMAFVAVVIIGIVLLLAEIGLKGDIADLMFKFANALAYIVVAVCSLVFATGKVKRKNGIWYLIVWAVAAVLITIAFIIPLVK